MGTATVTGELRDIALAALADVQGRIGWRLREPAVDRQSNLAIATRTRYTTPAADGSFQLHCWSTTELVPETSILVWWEWSESSPRSTRDELRWELRVPSGGGDFAALLAAPPPPTSIVLKHGSVTAADVPDSGLAFDTRGVVDPLTGQIKVPYYAGSGVTIYG